MTGVKWARCLAVCAVVFAIGCGPAVAQGRTHAGVIWTGLEFQDDVLAAYTGGVAAFNGDIDASGFFGRAQLVYVGFDFSSPASASGKANGDIYRANASLGYQVDAQWFRASLYGGLDLQERDFSPSAANSGKLDEEVGFIVSGRVTAKGIHPFRAALEGNFSTANETYWAKAQLDYAIANFAFGPDISFLGDREYDAMHVGGHASVELGEIVLEIGGGYNFANAAGGGSGGSDGVYGNGGIVFKF